MQRDDITASFTKLLHIHNDSGSDSGHDSSGEVEGSTARTVNAGTVEQSSVAPNPGLLVGVVRPAFVALLQGERVRSGRTRTLTNQGLGSFCRSRRLFAQPSLTDCRTLPIPSESAGTVCVITEPAAIYAPAPTSTGATMVELLPTTDLSPI